MTPKCQTHGCDRDADVVIRAKYGAVPKPRNRCEPCANAWKSGNHVTAGANVEREPIDP